MGSLSVPVYPELVEEFLLFLDCEDSIGDTLKLSNIGNLQNSSIQAELIKIYFIKTVMLIEFKQKFNLEPV